MNDVDSIIKAIETVQTYCKGSGAKVNVEKTVFMRIGEAKILPTSFAFKEEEHIKILGIIFGKDEKNSRNMMWEEILGGMERRLTFWKQRNLNLKGKVLIANTSLLSKMWYALSVMPIQIWVEKRLKKCILNFLWDCKPSRIAYDMLIGPIEEGGVGLMDVEQRKKSMRIKIIRKYLNEENNGDWKIIMKYFLNKCGGMGLEDDILWMKLKKRSIKGIPDFYKEVLEAWIDFLPHVSLNPQGREVLLNQPLFLNRHILLKNKEFFYKQWFEVAI